MKTEKSCKSRVVIGAMINFIYSRVWFSCELYYKGLKGGKLNLKKVGSRFLSFTCVKTILEGSWVKPV